MFILMHAHAFFIRQHVLTRDTLIAAAPIYKGKTDSTCFVILIFIIIIRTSWQSRWNYSCYLSDHLLGKKTNELCESKF